MQNSQRIRLLVVDDHKVVRNGLRIFISLYDDIKLVGEASNGEQAIRKCAQLQPDVVLMDLMMPVMDGPTAVHNIRQQHPEIQIVALTSFDEDELVHRALEAGAVGFLYKDVEEEELVGAIRAAYKGLPVLAPRAVEVVVKQLAKRGEVEEFEDLTPREIEILALVAKGKTNQQIADELVISRSTVNFHIHNILGKLHVKTRTEAVAVAIQNKLIST